MSTSTSTVQSSQGIKSALMSFLKHGPDSLMDDDIKPRQVPPRSNSGNRAAKARIDEPDTRILPSNLYPLGHTDNLQKLASLCVDVDQVKHLLRDQVKRRQHSKRHKPKVRFAREVLTFDLNTVIRELKEEKKAAADREAAKQRETGTDSAMAIDGQTPQKSKKKRKGKSKKQAPSAMDIEMQGLEEAMNNVDLKRKRSTDSPVEDDVPALKKVKDRLDLFDLVQDLPTLSPTRDPSCDSGLACVSAPQSATEKDVKDMAL